MDTKQTKDASHAALDRALQEARNELDNNRRFQADHVDDLVSLKIREKEIKRQMGELERAVFKLAALASPPAPQSQDGHQTMAVSPACFDDTKEDIERAIALLARNGLSVRATQ